MKTLYESILDDIDTQMKAGDNFIKTYKQAEKELDDIKKLCGDLSNWSGDEHETNSEYRDFRGIAVEYRILIKCGKLSKCFDLIGKNLFITLAFYPGMRRWSIEYKFTNANQAYRMPYRQNHLFIKSFKQAFEYQYNENGYKPGTGSRSKYTPEQIIKRFVLPKFENMEVFKSEIADMSKTLEKENIVTKYIDGPNV